MKQYVLMSNEELGELEHFGVRGMKWGVRNERVKSGAKKVYKSAKRKYKKVEGRAKKTKAYKAIKKYRDANKPRNKVVRPNKRLTARSRAWRMTDAELQKANNRLRLENEYRKLTLESRSKVAANLMYSAAPEKYRPLIRATMPVEGKKKK